MKRKLLFLSVIILSLLLRFWHLGANPPSLDWDEASLGYNAYSILRTLRDEYGNFLPVSIRSFNDYKPPLYTYLTVLPVSVFGLNEFSVRLPSAILGAVAVIAAYLLTCELLKRPKISLLTALFLCLSPWHLQFSRIAFEANIALTLIILAVLFYLKGLQKAIFLPLSGFMFGLSLYAYHSPRLIVPALIIGLTVIYYSRIKEKIISYLIFLIILALFFLPVFKELNNSSSARFSSVSSINPDEKLTSSIKDMEYDLNIRGDVLGKILHNRRLVFAREIIAGYLDHFNFDFLFLTGDAPGRHHAADQGMLYYFDLPLAVIGFLCLIRKISEKSSQTIFLLFLVAPLASSLTSGTPHAVRAIFYLPLYQIFSSLGLLSALFWLSSRFSKLRKNLLFIIYYLLFVINIFYLLHQYYVHTPIEHAPDWQYGYKEVVKIANVYQDKVNRIIVTYKYDQPYIFFLFYNKIDPLWYQLNWGKSEIKRAERKFGKYEFRNIDWEKDKELKNVLIIGSASEIPADSQNKIADINFPDKSPAFRIVLR
ncbi:hypothetical protein A3D78_06875 [Candidatus Gottesmanbacteria bacterium RIFCSPHIGHO2_02_FULL_39_14]|uniref:Glycosyltransferase RgtA/B/C/D-like domain-containing protein n=1 Tax=Candidatus Gottesmanbacteria bacterium RIFCSPHIGHO2_02_FULL_39_14 TaxID=1798383 RepID=A0A1F5ZW85_9BACT|nr:MAG: hypothetical protein A3D78_06875 [Candidatus Gottesmanbacteria bacterium RIFCSPHIGHO2_02_FULL_39_14]